MRRIAAAGRIRLPVTGGAEGIRTNTTGAEIKGGLTDQMPE